MYSRHNGNRHFTTVDIIGIDISLIDILGVDILGLVIPAPTPQNNLKTNANDNALFCQIMLMPMYCFYKLANANAPNQF